MSPPGGLGGVNLREMSPPWGGWGGTELAIQLTPLPNTIPNEKRGAATNKRDDTVGS